MELKWETNSCTVLYSGSLGCLRFHSVASWYFFATASNSPSPNNLPMKQILVGVPAFENPSGTTTQGFPVKLLMSRPFPANDGATTRSTFSKSLPISWISKYRIRWACKYSTAGTNLLRRKVFGHEPRSCCFNRSSQPERVSSSKAAAPSVESKNEMLSTG